MTPQEAILKQSEPQKINKIELTQSQKQSMVRNAKVFEDTYAIAEAFLKPMNADCMGRIARKLFGENGTMRTRKDPEANAWRSAIRNLVKFW